jgi:hypothetical protein
MARNEDGVHLPSEDMSWKVQITVSRTYLAKMNKK